MKDNDHESPIQNRNGVSLPVGSLNNRIGVRSAARSSPQPQIAASSPMKRRRLVLPRTDRLQKGLGVVLFLLLCRNLDWAFHQHVRSPDGEMNMNATGSASAAKPISRNSPKNQGHSYSFTAKQGKEETAGSRAETMQLKTTDTFSDRQTNQRPNGKVSLSSSVLAQNATLDSNYKKNESGELFGDSRYRCEANYNESFPELINNMKNSTVFCNSHFMKRLKCKCWNPLQPHRATGQYTDGWMKASGMNIALANNASRTLDVVFLGDSITEGWNGRWLGSHHKSFANNSRAFRRLFSREEGGQLDGLALGIANDVLVSLLYRIMHGEIPATLQAKVFWVLIGTNDLGKSSKCSPEATVAGIIRIIQELKKLRPESTVVVNSILPTSQSGKLLGRVIWEDRIQNVNQRMECYSHTTEGVEFFNATDIFTDKDGNMNKTLMMKDLLHPSWVGYDVWGEHIVTKVKELT